MGRIVVTEFVSLDGVMQAPGGGEDYEHAGWTFEIARGEEGDRFKLDEALSAEALLLGRVTYEGFAAAWPSMQGEFADKFNAMPKYVVSSTLKDPTWNNSSVLDGDVAEQVTALRKQPGGDVVVNGSAQLVQTLVQNDLVDELRLMVFPVLLGSGKRLFARDERQEEPAADRFEDRRRWDRDPHLPVELGLQTRVCAGPSTATRRRSVGLVLLVGLAVHGLALLAARRPARLLLGCGIAHDQRGCMFVAVGGVFDQLPLGQLEALGLASAGLLDRSACLAASRIEIQRVGHKANSTRTAGRRDR